MKRRLRKEKKKKRKEVKAKKRTGQIKMDDISCRDRTSLVWRKNRHLLSNCSLNTKGMSSSKGNKLKPMYLHGTDDPQF